MEDEIHIGEILAALWRGKYLIIAITAGAALITLAASILFTTPLFEAKASIETTPFDINSEKLIRRLNEPDLINRAADKLGCDRDDLVETILETEESIILVTVKSPDASLSLSAVKVIGEILFEQAAELRRKEYSSEITSLKIALDAVEEEFYAYTPKLDDYYEELFIRKESIKDSIEMIDDYIDHSYENLDRDLKLLAMEMDQRYIALFEQKGSLKAELAEIRALIRKVELGIMTETLREHDSYYSYLLDQIAHYRSLIERTAFRIDDLEQRKARNRADDYISILKVPSEPVNISWQLNTAVSAVLGLMISVMLVFMKPFFSELKKELKETGSG